MIPLWYDNPCGHCYWEVATPICYDCICIIYLISYLDYITVTWSSHFPVSRLETFLKKGIVIEHWTIENRKPPKHGAFKPSVIQNGSSAGGWVSGSISICGRKLTYYPFHFLGQNSHCESKIVHTQPNNGHLTILWSWLHFETCVSACDMQHIRAPCMWSVNQLQLQSALLLI